jgi:hypothetical protein
VPEADLLALLPAVLPFLLATAKVNKRLIAIESPHVSST